jgi:hypothetical protein
VASTYQSQRLDGDTADPWGVGEEGRKRRSKRASEKGKEKEEDEEEEEEEEEEEGEKGEEGGDDGEKEIALLGNRDFVCLAYATTKTNNYTGCLEYRHHTRGKKRKVPIDNIWLPALSL